MSNLVNQRSIAAISCLALIMAGCATKSPVPPYEPRTFRSVAIVSPAEFITYVTPETRSQKAAEGAGTGAGVTGAGAMAAGALLCGPFFFGLCVAGLGLAGMAVGGVGGLAYAVTGISGDDVETLDSKLRETGESGDLQTQLTESVRSKLSEKMLATVAEAEVQAILSIHSMELRHSEEDFYLKLTARFEYARGGGDESDGGYREIAARSTRHDLDYWLSADPAEMQNAVDECLEKLSTEISRRLNQRWSGAQDSEAPQGQGDY